MEFKSFTYDLKGNIYYVFIIKRDNIWEYWLNDKDYGVMLLMFALNEYNLEILENNLEDYVENYKKYLKE